ncbi:condensation domain-containing protein, partial [Mycobacterium simulans]|uniref:condensation domain-containing protein n=1 Tax=Mycobacterium simulans TaxID=627089 RepID=UPI001CD5C1F5
VDEGVGSVLATPIMGWLAGVEGPVGQFNQTMLLQAPAGVVEGDVVVLVQALLDRHAMLRARLVDDGVGGWSLEVGPVGCVDAAGCVESVAVLSEEVLVAARGRLDPGAGVMVSAVWVSAVAQLVVVIHHLAVDGVSWRVLFGDLNAAWQLQRAGNEPVLAVRGTSFRQWAMMLGEQARAEAVVAQAPAWRDVAKVAPVLPLVDPAVDTFAAAGSLSVSLDVASTRMVLGAVPAAFGVGVGEVLLIAYALAWAQFLGTGATPVGIDVEGHGRVEELAAGLDLSQTVGWFTTKYPVALGVGGLSWARVCAGDAGLGAVIKDAKEQLRAMPPGWTYGVLRYLNNEVDLCGGDPAIGFNYLGRVGAGAAGEDAADAGWRIGSADSVGAVNSNAGLAMPLMHTVDLNAVTVDGGEGPRLQADWLWAPSKLDRDQIERVSGLWFEALRGMCAHVSAGGGGLTPSDIVPARLDQPQIDELERRHRVADILPLTPLQQGLLFHTANTGHGEVGQPYAVQFALTVSGRLDVDRLHRAVDEVVGRHPHLVARFVWPQADQPVQILPRDPVVPWRYVDLSVAVDLQDQIQRVCAVERGAVCDISDQSPLRVAVICVGVDEHRLVLTNHHIVLDGWSMPILLREIFGVYHHQSLPAALPFRRFVSWLAGRD